MGIKIDLLTGLTIVAVIGVLVTMGLSTAKGDEKVYVSDHQLNSSVYQVAYKRMQIHK